MVSLTLMNDSIQQTHYMKKSIFFVFQESSNAADLSSNRKCAEICFIKNPSSFWIRLEDLKTDYYEMIEQLQIDYQDAHVEP